MNDNITRERLLVLTDRYNITYEAQGLVYKYEAPQSLLQKVIGRATEHVFPVWPLSEAKFMEAFHEWRAAQEKKTAELHSPTWFEWYHVNQAFSAACELNAGAYAAIKAQLTETEARLLPLSVGGAE